MRQLPPKYDHDVIERETGLPNPMWTDADFAWPNGTPRERIVRAAKRAARWLRQVRTAASGRAVG
ncbi:hypothetical protein Q5424_09510 [Conexibacter sp. JD483]|uniref:hypothetical protein n=1 Tax=unclassified Conexibacter TaxID=2627773 RepID=UPI002725A82B|nr:MULTISPECIES: hypothetical protein [unclassified Conexibacter]MDO8187186.1 hypothetical protein [Conexibacter sp. CPCC 205706]MDO8199283.1 hypothetical protein [Conexibacter sp. CPCC 205762]MDR9369316.1 hypothetical protein [Conexibacter sp. JD483]